jgi:hypothetical protein
LSELGGVEYQIFRGGVVILRKIGGSYEVSAFERSSFSAKGD